MVLGTDQLSAPAMSTHIQLDGLNGFRSSGELIDLDPGRHQHPPSGGTSHLSAARLYLNLPARRDRSDPGDHSNNHTKPHDIDIEQDGELQAVHPPVLKPSPMIANPHVNSPRNRSATVSDPAEIRATSPHLRSTFDRDRLNALVKPSASNSSSNTNTRPIVDLEIGTNLAGGCNFLPFSSPQPLPSPVPTDHQGVDPLDRSPPKRRGSDERKPGSPLSSQLELGPASGSETVVTNVTPSTPQNQRQRTRTNSNQSQTGSNSNSNSNLSPTSSSIKDGSKTSAFFSTSFSLGVPAPPRPLADNIGSGTKMDVDGLPSSMSSSPHRSDHNHTSSPIFPVHSTSRSTHYFLPSERPGSHLEASSSNLNRARSLNSARPGQNQNQSPGPGPRHGTTSNTPIRTQAASSRSSAFFSTSFAATPPRSASPYASPVLASSPSAEFRSNAITHSGERKNMTASGFALGLGNGLGRGSPAGGKETSRSVTMPVTPVSMNVSMTSPVGSDLQGVGERGYVNLGEGSGSFISGIGVPIIRKGNGVPDPASPNQSPNSSTRSKSAYDPATVISPPRKLTREVSGTFGPRPVVKERQEKDEEPCRIRPGDILVAPEGESVPRLAQAGLTSTAGLSIRSTSTATSDSTEARSAQQEASHSRYWKVDRVMGEGAFSLVWSAREMVRSTRRSKSRPTLLVLQASTSRSERVGQEDADDEEEYEPKGDEVVAIKMMDKRMCKENDRTRISFVREVAVLRHLSHPHIVSYLSSFSTTQYHCLVLENLSGGELFDLLQTPGNHRRMGEDLVRRIFGELCRGVYWLHEAKVVHRDLKLENIMFTVNPFALVDKSDPTAKIPIDKLPTPLVKLTDFGLARFIDPASPMLQTRSGSESFTAPEIIMGNPYDGRDTDSWAVGVILFALVTGELPFDRVTSATAHDEEAQRRKRIMAIAKGDYKWPIGVGSEGVKKVVARLLTRDASKRTRVGPALWDEIWMHGPGSVPCPASRQPGATDETLPDGRIKLLDGFLLNKDIELEARRDAF